MREDSGNLTQRKAGSIPDIPRQAGSTGLGTWQLASKKVNITNSPPQLEGSENKHSIINNKKKLYRLPISLVKGGVKIQELLKSTKLLCSTPPGLSSGSTSESQTIPSQDPAINYNDKDDLSENEIKILKSKLVQDNNLEGLLDLENKIDN